MRKKILLLLLFVWVKGVSQNFGSFASAAWLTDCTSNNFFNTTGSGASIIGPVQNVFQSTDFGTFLIGSGTFKLRGGEVKTFKTSTGNVCSARMYYRVYPQSGTPGAFTTINLPFFDDCSGVTFPSGGPCTTGDQKWQIVLNDAQFPYDLTAFPAGNYNIEVYYDVTGDFNSTSACNDTILINNNGANFIATYTLQNTPGYFGTDPSTCNGTDGSILITNLAPNTAYNLSYEDDAMPVTTTVSSTNSGDYTISGLNAGAYTNIILDANNCQLASGSLTLFNPIITPTFDPVAPLCNGELLSPLPTISNEGITGSWEPELNNTATTTYTFTPDSSGATGPNLIVNGDFSAGNSGFNSDYQFLTDAGQSGVQKAYGIVTAANLWFQFFPPCTVRTATSGSMMVVDGSTTNAGNDKVWEQTVAVQPNQTYTFSYWLQTVATPNPALIDVTINGTSIGTVSAPATNCQWAQHSFTWNSGTNTTAQIAIFDRIILANGNDFSLDDLSFTATTIVNQCAIPITLTITVNQPTIATFNSIPDLCIGGNVLSLPANSIEGFTGTWFPNSIDNTQTATYAFTPTAGQCALNGALTLTVLPNTISPTFSAYPSLITACQAGASLQVTLPITSDNGIIGTWSPSTLDYSILGTTVYTFTPDAGLCALNTTTITLIINENVVPTFTPITICAGTTTTLPTNSIENIAGSWFPAAVNTAQTTTYIFTPTSGQCATTGSLTIVVNQPAVATFNVIAPICSGNNAPSLPVNSNENFSGSWSPNQISNTQSGNYVFTPTAGQCAAQGTLSITVTPRITTTFTAIPPICPGETPPSLPLSSVEGVFGTWTPALINNTSSATYTFVPDAATCASNGNLAITVQAPFDFIISDSCDGNNFVLEVKSIANSVDLTTADYIWLNTNNEVIGTNIATLNVTEYLASTAAIETAPYTFSVRVVNSEGCSQLKSISLDKVYCGIQKGISVNNDGLNDFFDLTHLDVKNLSIFNRYGLKVYHKNQYKDEWKGQSDQGDDLPDATYFYVIEFTTGTKTKTGWIYKVSGL